ncbi:hypothetical protein HZS_4789, partial [Henneguya salminicola]
MDLIPKPTDESLKISLGNKNSKLSAPKKIVLKEEEYVSKIDQIIERDFFPDLERLRLKNEYQSALDSNDLEKLRDVQIKWGKLIADESINGTINEPDNPEEPQIRFETLDEFLSTYTSEDNISFEQIVEETREKQRKKYWWLYEAQEEALKSIKPNEKS